MERLNTFQMFLRHLDKMTSNTQAALVNNTNWWTFGPLVCRKFINHANSLNVIFTHVIVDCSNKENPYFDISSIWSLVKALHETHGVFRHLFKPCKNIEENILRFRLWELHSLQSILQFKRDLVEDEISDTLSQLFKNEKECLLAIERLSLFQQISERSQKLF